MNLSTFSTQYLGGEPGDPDSLWQGRYNRSRYDLLSCVVEQYASDAINDAIGSGKAKHVKGASKSALSFASGGCDVGGNWEAWGAWGKETLDDGPRVLLVAVRSYVTACHYLCLNIIYEICIAIFSAKNSEVSNDRTGPT